MAAPNIAAPTNIDGKLLNTPALLASGDTTIYSVPTGKTVKFAGASITNVTAVPVTVSVSIVPSGGTASTANRVLASYPLAGLDTISHADVLGVLAGYMLGEGQFVVVNVDTASAVTMSLSGTIIS